ncbi:MAG: hypothetical protein AB7V18_07635 [Pyrinomonadaceae bacterium]
MDIIFPTDSEQTKLELRNCNKFEDGSGYSVDLIVLSEGFGLEIEFFFEQWPLNQFIGSLTEMESSLRGEAVLKPMWEDDYIKLEMLELGHLLVQGGFTQHSPHFQQLSFAFGSDQSALGPFLIDLRKLIQL